MNPLEAYDFSLRCPRCNGFLHDAAGLGYPRRPDSAGPVRVFKDKLHCFNCGRLWVVEDGDFYHWPAWEPVKVRKR